MPIDRLLNIVAATVNSIGVAFVFIGTFRLITSDLSTQLTPTPYQGFSLDRLRTLSRQKRYTASGLILIFIALLFQTLPLVLIHEPWEILGGHDRIALTLALSLGIIVAIPVFRLNVLIRKRTEEQVKRSVMKGRLARVLNQNPLRRAHWSSVVEDAETLLGIPPRPKNEPVEVFLRKLAQEFNISFPVGLQIEDDQANRRL